MKISVCMIVKNEESVISRALDSVKDFADEIIIVDTGSTDNTKKICKQYTNNIYDFKWIDDFSVARNFSFSKATCDYIMWLDADDVIDKKNQNKIIALKANNIHNIDCFMMKYAISFDENNNPTFVYYRERLVKNNNTFFWSDPVHEVITPHGNIKYLDIEIQHRKIKATPTARNLKIYEKLLKDKTKLTPRQKFYYSRELYYNYKYKKAIKSFNEYLKDYNGWKENKIEACLTRAQCYLALKDSSNALSSLYDSFTYDLPRAEILSEISSILLELNFYDQCIFWANIALKTKPNISSGAFIKTECYDLVPLLNIVVAYYHMGKYLLANDHNNKVLKLYPNNLSAIHNKDILSKLIK